MKLLYLLIYFNLQDEMKNMRFDLREKEMKVEQERALRLKVSLSLLTIFLLFNSRNCSFVTN